MSLRIEPPHGLNICVKIGIVGIDVVDDFAVGPPADLENRHLFPADMISKRSKRMPKAMNADWRQSGFFADAIDLIVQALFAIIDDPFSIRADLRKKLFQPRNNDRNNALRTIGFVALLEYELAFAV